ncbi:MAG TPA: trypsin-like peptidase domain-containing protein [Acidimicrobiales bacterium]
MPASDDLLVDDSTPLYAEALDPATEPFAPPSAAPVPAPSALLPPPPPPGKKPKHTTLRAAVVGGVVGAVVAGGVAFATVKLTDDQPTVSAPVTTAAPSAGAPSPSLAGEALDIHALLDKVGPSVVAIELGRNTGNGIFGFAAGSGVVISADGYVVTNAHVVDGADAITVKLADGRELTADLIGSLPSNDIALVKVRNVTDLRPAVLGNSKDLRVGDDVVAIGNALNLGDTPTVTTGIVSAKGRTLDAGDVQLSDLIQTDAAINRGNSGGALVNARGEVVGIPSAGIPNAQNLGFAIEIDAVKPLIEQLKNGKSTVAVQAFLGVSSVAVADLDASDLERLEITADSGVAVMEVQEQSAAEDAGLQVGDVIVRAGGVTVDTPASLRAAIQAKKPGDELTLEINRKGETKTVTAKLGSRPVAQG